MRKALLALLILAGTSCLPRHVRPMVQMDRKTAARALNRALKHNAITQELIGFGHYRGTQGFLAMEGSFSFKKDSQAIKVIMHGPFGGIIQETELPNQGPASVIFQDSMPDLADSVAWARLSGDLLVVCLRVGFDTALVSVEKNRITGLALWGESFVLSDYKPVEEDLSFPFRIDYRGSQASATLVFDSLRLLDQRPR